MTTISLFTKLLFGPNPGSDHIVKTSLEAPEDMPEGIGGMYAPSDDVEHDERRAAPHAPDHHHHRPHAREADHARPHAPIPHHHRPSEHAPAASIRPMTPEELKGGPSDKTGHHHRPFDKGAAAGKDWAPHMDPRGFVPHQKVKAALIKRGFSPEDASAITGNLIYESGGNQYSGHPVILNPPRGGQSGDAARGAAQWEKGGGRWEGLSSPSLDAQVDHIWNEMHGPEARSYAAMRGAKTVGEKAHIVNTMYERPRYPGESDRERVRLAEEAYRGRDELASTGATPGTGGGGATPGVDTGRVADIASRLAGKRVTDRDVQSFISSTGRGHPSSLWCADFVGAALAHAGYDSPRTRMATDYLRYGTPVAPGEARRGDVIVEGRHLTRPVPGHLGHVGIAGGPPQMHDGQMMIPEISGDFANRVEAEDWANPRTAQIRRPTRKAEK
jgi:Phage tail lysozyme